MAICNNFISNAIMDKIGVQQPSISEVPVRFIIDSAYQVPGNHHLKLYPCL